MRSALARGACLKELQPELMSVIGEHVHLHEPLLQRDAPLPRAAIPTAAVTLALMLVPAIPPVRMALAQPRATDRALPPSTTLLV